MSNPDVSRAGGLVERDTEQVRNIYNTYTHVCMYSSVLLFGDSC